MENHERHFVRQSVQDVIRILHDAPVRPDMIPQITIVQVMNRIPIAHLSIERALKFLITESGGNFEEKHDLPSRFEELKLHNTEAAGFLEESFQDAVQHYRYNTKAPNMGYLKTLTEYLKATGSNTAFQNMRYWELKQSLNEPVLRKILLPLHVELLHAVRELLLIPNRPMNKTTDRVERTVRDALGRYARGTSTKESSDSYKEWLKGHRNFREAMAAAVKDDFKIGDAYAEDNWRKAYLELTKSSDPAVWYFANTLDVLPRQPRDVVPEVDWLGPEKERHGEVSTPGGTNLGFIDRGADGVWYITPSRDGLVRVSAKAQSQTDARCCLATLMTKRATINTNSGEKEVRIVGEEFDIFGRDYNTDKMHSVTFWDENHGLQEGQEITIKTQIREPEGTAIQVLEGTITGIAGSEISISGVQTVRLETNSEQE